LRCFALVDRARDGFLTVRVLAGFFLAAFFLAGFFLAGFFLAGFFLAAFFLAAFFLTVVLLAGFLALVRAFRRVRRGFLAFALDAFRFLPFAVRLALVVLARFTRLAFARFFFIAPVLPPLACASIRRGEPYRRSTEVVKALVGNLPEPWIIQRITGDNTLLCHRWMV
jgi:hypothetical protein